jgi:steroid delta-isomerase
MEETSAADVALRAMRSVQARQRETWLGLFATHAVLEDPVGHAPPRDGAGEVAEFWDAGIGVLEDVRFDVRRIHASPREAVVLADVAIRAPGGATATYDAVIHYTLDDSGAIIALRAFWDLPAVMAQLAA